jgi:hypothetical protein
MSKRVAPPIGVIRDLVQIIRRDPEGFLRSRALKRERESWVVLIGIHKLTGDYWFMRMENDDPPDATVVMFQADASGKRPMGFEVPVEVVFIPKHVKGQQWDARRSQEENVFAILDRTKFRTKRYEPGTTLFVYLNLTQSGFRLDSFSRLVEDRKPQLGGVWLLFAVSPDGEAGVPRNPAVHALSD